MSFGLGFGNNNLLPEPPALIYPGPGELIPLLPGFTVAASSDPDSADPVTYGFRVYGDAACTNLVASGDNIQYTIWSPALGILQQDTQYWWRAYAADTQAWGKLGPGSTFTTSSGPLASVPGFSKSLQLDLLDPTGSTNIRFALGLPQSGDISVRVYNARGQLLKTLASGYHGEGRHVLVWNGLDGNNRKAATGVYFVNARQGSRSITTRVLQVR